VERGTLAQLEDPLLGAIGGLEALGEVRLGGILRVDLNQRCGEKRFAEMEGEAVRPGGRVERVGGLAVANGALEDAALLGLGAGRGREHGVGGGERHARANRELHEVAAGKLALAHGLRCGPQFHFKFGHTFLSLVTGRDLGA
jgi:hypothetical protein